MGRLNWLPTRGRNLARLRVDTPSMRGNYNMMQLSSKRSIRSLDHFAEVEEYFDGDPGMQQAIGPRGGEAAGHEPHGRLQCDSGFPARSETHAADEARFHKKPPFRNCGASGCSTARPSASNAIPARPSPTIISTT